MEISHVKADTTEGAGTGNAESTEGRWRVRPRKSYEDKSEGDGRVALAPATPPLASTSCRLSRDSAGLIRSRGERGRWRRKREGKGRERGGGQREGNGRQQGFAPRALAEGRQSARKENESGRTQDAFNAWGMNPITRKPRAYDPLRRPAVFIL